MRLRQKFQQEPLQQMKVESLEPAVDAHTEALVEMITDVMNVKGIPGLENFSLSQLEPDKKK